MQNTSTNQRNSASETGENPPVDWAVSDKPRPERTLGLKVLDAFIYPFMNNFAVFAISVYATYMTKHGDKHGGEGFIGSFNRWLKGRGEKMINLFKGWGMNNEQAETSKMVFFSFLDGSLLAPFIKLFEDRRESIARGLDTMFGTVPEDESVYAAEPKQTWKSVLLGRAATAAIVVPTAVLLDKWKVNGDVKNKNTGEWEKGKVSLNAKLFEVPGEKTGERIEKKYPGVKKKFSKIDLPYFFRTGAFEAFYTSVCTAGLYFSSRFIATHDDKKRIKEVATQKTEFKKVPSYTKKTAAKSIDVPTESTEVTEKENHAEEKPNDKKSYVSKLKSEETNQAPTLNA